MRTRANNNFQLLTTHTIDLFRGRQFAFFGGEGYGRFDFGKNFFLQTSGD